MVLRASAVKDLAGQFASPAIERPPRVARTHRRRENPERRQAFRRPPPSAESCSSHFLVNTQQRAKPKSFAPENRPQVSSSRSSCRCTDPPIATHCRCAAFRRGTVSYSRRDTVQAPAEALMFSNTTRRSAEVPSQGPQSLDRAAGCPVHPASLWRCHLGESYSSGERKSSIRSSAHLDSSASRCSTTTSKSRRLHEENSAEFDESHRGTRNRRRASCPREHADTPASKYRVR